MNIITCPANMNVSNQLGFQIVVGKRTPQVAFLVNPPIFEEIKLMHIIYGIVLT
jgi:hypothetical protein